MKTVTVLLFIGALCALGECYPLHASCRLTWAFPSMNCSDVQDKLVAQMTKWNMNAPCGSSNNSEKCLYQIKSKSPSELKGTHTTPVKRYVDDLTFSFNGTATTCTVGGYSTSEVFYAVLDYGTNYCNLRNLADGSGLSTASGFKEDTSDKICTQYSSHDCEKY